MVIVGSVVGLEIVDGKAGIDDGCSSGKRSPIAFWSIVAASAMSPISSFTTKARKLQSYILVDYLLSI